MKNAVLPIGRPHVQRRIQLLADDLTGALDSAAAFAGDTDGASVPVFLDEPQPHTYAVQAVSTGSRDIDPAALEQALRPCLSWFQQADGLAFKKVDSLLRGNTFAEIAWLMQSGQFDGAVFAPAFPALGRFTQAGQHWCGLPHQPQAPRQPIYPLGLDKAFADFGLIAHLGSSSPGLGQVCIPDVLCDADLTRLAHLSLEPQARRWLWCGSAGLAEALASQHRPATNCNVSQDKQNISSIWARTDSQDDAQGLVLFVTASHHPVLQKQWKYLKAKRPAGDFFNLTEDPTSHLENTRSFMLHPGHQTALIKLSCDTPLTPTQAQAQLSRQTQWIARHLPCPTALVVVGGDSLLALCRATGAQRLNAASSPRSGWGAARFSDGVWAGVTCYSRSGAFGPEDDLHDFLNQRPLSPSLI